MQLSAIISGASEPEPEISQMGEVSIRESAVTELGLRDCRGEAQGVA